jgi:protein-S-isoprenylcysteine O-methyltransferase Ste14
MNAFILLIPIILLRYGLLGILNKEALKRAAFSPPVTDREKAAAWSYVISNILMFLILFFLKISASPAWSFYGGLILYGLGSIFYMLTIVNYAKPKGNGINKNGFYRISRNPMYVAYFIYFLGCVMLTQSWILLALLIIFQISSHWIILSEERWCTKVFGDEYIQYMKNVRRYI